MDDQTCLHSSGRLEWRVHLGDDHDTHQVTSKLENTERVGCFSGALSLTHSFGELQIEYNVENCSGGALKSRKG